MDGTGSQEETASDALMEVEVDSLSAMAEEHSLALLSDEGASSAGSG